MTRTLAGTVLLSIALAVTGSPSQAAPHRGPHPTPRVTRAVAPRPHAVTPHVVTPRAVTKPVMAKDKESRHR